MKHSSFILDAFHFAKYAKNSSKRADANRGMHIITEKHLNRAAVQYPEAANEIAAWRKLVKLAHWRNFVSVREVFKDADAVRGYVIFNFRKNRYRLITVIHYAREKEGRLTEGHIYIRSFLTHSQYDNPANWDRGKP